MKKLKIGYWPLSTALGAAGDRRRLVFWAKARGHSIVMDLSEKVDVIVVSEGADLKSNFFKDTNVPIVFDLVDAYLSPSNYIDDLMRGVAKRCSGQLSQGLNVFSEYVKEFCISSNAVICSSVEQERIVKQFQDNTHVILDSHEEFPLLTPQKNFSAFTGPKKILWEGQSATIRGVREISLVLENLAKTKSISLEFITDEKYFLLMNKFLGLSTLKLLKKELSAMDAKITLKHWTVENLVTSAKSSSLSMIPLDLSVPMQNLKPENRLLIMWRLGLPCLASASPAYSRVSSQAGVDATSTQYEDWIEKFDRILRDPSYALEQVKRGQDYIRDHHNSSILLNKWDTAIESVIS